MPVTAKQILQSIPNRFRPEKAANYDTVFHFDITGEEVLQYTIEIKDSVCKLSEGLIGTADCVISTKAAVYVDLETGKANPQTAFMMGRIKVSNISAMMHFSKCFRKFSEDTAEDVKVNSRATKAGPLAGVKIIDFTRLLPGPLATMFLADMGADVIKVEDPDNPDYIRGFEPQINGVSMFYLSLNRSKRSLAVNYVTEQGRKAIHDLVKSADVLVEQFRPGVMAKMGFGYEQLAAINPRLIYISITGYGQDSSWAQVAGHDLNYIAIAGALDITGHENGTPVIPGFQLGDIAGGSYMAMNAVLAALYQREKTGKGEHVDVAMADGSLPFTALQFAYQQGTKASPGRGKFELSGALANYNVYQCSDGKYLAVGSLEPKFWNALCKRVGKPDWSTRFLNKGDELDKLKAEVKDMFLTRPQNEWINIFKDDDICLTKVNTLDELEHDAYLTERGMFCLNEHPAVGKYKTINQPLKFKQAKFDNNWNAPQLGEDTAAVLKGLGYSDTDIKDLKKKGLIKY